MAEAKEYTDADCHIAQTLFFILYRPAMYVGVRDFAVLEGFLYGAFDWSPFAEPDVVREKNRVWFDFKNWLGERFGVPPSLCAVSAVREFYQMAGEEDMCARFLALYEEWLDAVGNKLEVRKSLQ